MLITKRHQERCLAKHQQKAETTAQKKQVKAARTAAPLKDQLAAVSESLAKDLQVLSGIESVVDKAALKRELLPKYEPFVARYLEAEANYQNDIIFYVALWSLDTGDIQRAFDLFDVAIHQQQQTPDKFSRDMPTLAAELIHDWAERQLKESDSASPYIDDVFTRVTNDQWPVSTPIVAGKVAKIAGLHCESRNELKEALAYFEAAEKANPEKAGVKTRISKLKKQLNVA